MKKQMVLIFSLLGFLALVNCNSTSGASCRNSCNEKENICIIAMANVNTPAVNFLGCELYKSSCISGCTSRSSSSTSSTRTSSRTNTSSSSNKSSSSSSSSNNSGGGGGSSSSGSSGSGGSSHSIVADTEN